MPAALALAAEDVDLVADYVTTLQRAGLRTGRSTVQTVQAAKSFCAKLQRSGGWSELSRARQIDAIRKARAFTSWLLVTSQLTVTADVLGRVDLRLGNAARTHCPDAHRWFVDAGERIGISPVDIGLQWNTLAKITAITATPANQVGTAEFESARTAITKAYVERGLPSSGRNMASIFHRLQLTLFHAGRLDTHRRPTARPPVSVSGWTVVAPGFADVARRYVTQVDLSLRPATVKHGEAHRGRPARVRHLARPRPPRRGQLRRSPTPPHRGLQGLGRRQARALHQQAVEPDQHQEPADQPALLLRPDHRVGLPQPAAPAAHLRRRPAHRRQAPPTVPRRRGGGQAPARLPRRPGPAVAADRGAAGPHRDPQKRTPRPHRRRRRADRLRVLAPFWLRIPVGKLHNDRYIPLHPQLKELLDDWITNHRPTGLRSDRLLLERNRPVTPLRVAARRQRPEPSRPRGRA